MRRSLHKTLPAILTGLLLATPAVAQDVDGSEDHPLITRYPGSAITWYERQEFEPYRIAVGPVTGYRNIDDWVEVEGRITRINYALRADQSFYEIYSNYLSAVRSAGFEILAEGYDQSGRPRGEIGQRGFLGVHYAANPIPPGASFLLQGSATSGGSGYVAAKLERAGGTAYIVMSTTQYSQDAIITFVDIIEARPMEDDLVSVDANAMARDIDIYGKVALYGIYFDHDQATVKPESEEALAQIAALLGIRSDLELYVVGHTDMSGDLEYNVELSRRRAVAVVDALTERFGIASSRLIARGVGPLVPVMTNNEDPGRARNRRVELVEK